MRDTDRKGRAYACVRTGWFLSASKRSALLLFLLCVLLPAGCASLLQGSLVEFKLHQGVEPMAITVGSDGALWFVEQGGEIGRLTVQGQLTEFPLPGRAPIPGGIAAGQDQALWFTDANSGTIGRITVQGRITEFPLSDPMSGPGGITRGPDGALWFTEVTAGKIGRITVQGQITEFPLPTPNTFPSSITRGPDDALWFIEATTGKIGRITVQGQITEFPPPTGTSPQQIAPGPDRALWFTASSRGGGEIGRITVQGQITLFPVPPPDSAVLAITQGPDGALWFTETVPTAVPVMAGDTLAGVHEGKGSNIERITVQGQITAFALPDAASDPGGITVGPDGALWFTDAENSKVERFHPSLSS